MFFILVSVLDFPFSRGFSQRGQWHPTPVLLPGQSHGQRSLVGCSPWGHKESDTIEQLTHREFYLQKNRLSEVILVITNEETFEAK